MGKLFNSYVLIVLFSMILILNMTYFKIYGIPDPSLKVKIVYPYKNSSFTINDNMQVKGTSKYTPDFNCTVSLIINDKKPYTPVIPKGINGTKDFTKWEFVIDKNYTLVNGTNKITAKNYCLKSNSSVFYSVLFNISSKSNIVSNQTSNLNGTSASNTATNEVAKNVTIPSPSVSNIVSNQTSNLNGTSASNTATNELAKNVTIPSPSVSNIVSNQTSNLNGTSASNTATNELAKNVTIPSPSVSNIVAEPEDLKINKNFIPNFTASLNTICCQSLNHEEQKLPKVSDGLLKKVSADSSPDKPITASEAPAKEKKEEKGA